MISAEELSSFELFCELGKKQLQVILNYLKPHLSKKETKARTTIIQPGETCKDIILIQKGVIKAVEYTLDGKEQVGNIFLPGDIFGCIEAITGHIFRSYVQTERDTTLILFPIVEFINLMEMMLPFKDAVIKYMAYRSEDFVAHSFVLKHKKARDRICIHLLQQISSNRNSKQGYEFSFNIELLARFLNLTRSVLSKELHALQDEGVLRLEKNYIYIQNMDALVNLAQNDHM